MPLLAPAVLGLALVTTVLILTAILSPSLGGYGGQILWAYHPVFMTVGIVLLMTMGLVSYVNDFGTKFHRLYPDRASRRLLHGSLQLFAALLVLAGYLVAFTVHEGSGRSHIAANSPVSHKVHVWLGLLVLGGTLLQVLVGLYKYVLRTRDEVKWATWHGKVGPLVWALGFVALAVAVYMVFYSAGRTAMAIAIWILLAALLGLALFQLLWGSGRGNGLAAAQVQATGWDRGDEAAAAASGLMYGGRGSITSLNSKLLYAPH